MSMLVPCSMSFPFWIRRMSMNSHSTRLPVGGGPTTRRGGCRGTSCAWPPGLVLRVAHRSPWWRRKRLQKPAIERLEAGGRPICGGSDCASFRCIVIDELRVEDFVGEVQIVLGLADVDETPHELSVVLRRHCRSLPHVTRYGRIGLPVNC